jgi:hypothetical protein
LKAGAFCTALFVSFIQQSVWRKFMDTSHEILQEAKAALIRIKEKESQWTGLKGWARAPGKIGILLFICALFVLSDVLDHASNSKSRLLWSIIFLLWLSLLLIRQQRKNKRLLKIIQNEAPELYQNLKDKDVLPSKPRKLPPVSIDI